MSQQTFRGGICTIQITNQHRLNGGFWARGAFFGDVFSVFAVIDTIGKTKLLDFFDQIMGPAAE